MFEDYVNYCDGQSRPVPTVAIALPVYNGADHLEEALRSFQLQRFADFELTICDNASTDLTADIAKRFAQVDRRFIYIHETEFLSAKDNFIRAYRSTRKRAKYFLWACDDNVWHPDFLAKTVACMEADNACTACGVFLHHFGDGQIRKVQIRMPAVFKISRSVQFAFERMSLTSLYSLMRRSAIDKVELELGTIRDYPDRYYLAQLRAQGRFNVIEEDLLAFRTGGISSSGDDIWVQTVIDGYFGKEEYRTLFALPHLSRINKVVLAAKWTYMALRHNIPNVVRRWWLAPVHLAARVINSIKPSSWVVTNRGLQQVDRQR